MIFLVEKIKNQNVLRSYYRYFYKLGEGDIYTRFDKMIGDSKDSADFFYFGFRCPTSYKQAQ